MTSISLPIIGYHKSPLSQKFGLPRQPNLVALNSVIEFEPPFDSPAAFEGIESYSHLWVLWQFHQNKPQANFRPQVRPPRLGGNDKIGVFATRSMYRPSGLGLSVVALQKLEIVENRARLHILGADMVDGTPIIDIKPYLPYADSVATAVSQDIDRPSVRQVVLSESALLDFEILIGQGVLGHQDRLTIQELISQDPRPAYRQNQVGVLFFLRYAGVDVEFFMDEKGILVVQSAKWVG